MPELDIKLHKSWDSLLRVTPQIMSYPVLGLDIETTGLDPYTNSIVSFQIANNLDNTIHVVDARKDNFQQFFNTLAVYKGEVCIQNAKFDLKFLNLKHGLLYLNLFDTYLAEKLYHAGRKEHGFGLDDLAEIYLKIKLDKSIRNEFILPMFYLLDLSEEQMKYAALDAWVLPRIAQIQKAQLEKDGLTKVMELENQVVSSVVKIELNGFKLDVPAWTRIFEEEKVIATNLAIELREMAGWSTFNPGSDDQVKVAMRKLDLEVPVFRGKETTRGVFLRGIKHPFVTKLLDYRKASKRVSTYGEEFLGNIHPVTGRIHAEFNQLGTDTGRFSSEKPNFQNIPEKEDGKKYRRCFVARDGHKIIGLDFSNQEMLIMAELSGDPALINVYHSGKEVHRGTASLVFKVPYEEVGDNQREMAKTTNYAVAYGSTAWNIAMRLDIPIVQVDTFLEDYWKIYGTLQKWQRRSGLLALLNGFSKTILGRRRYYLDMSDRESVMRKGTNQEVQGTAGDMFKLAVVKIDDAFRNRKLHAHFTNWVHDEIVIESLENEAEEVAQVAKEEMEAAGAEFVKVVKQTAKVKIGDCWL